MPAGRVSLRDAAAVASKAAEASPARNRRLELVTYRAALMRCVQKQICVEGQQ